jgi:hypothetical protein
VKKDQRECSRFSAAPSDFPASTLPKDPAFLGIHTHIPLLAKYFPTPAVPPLLLYPECTLCYFELGLPGQGIVCKPQTIITLLTHPWSLELMPEVAELLLHWAWGQPRITWQPGQAHEPDVLPPTPQEALPLDSTLLPV